MRSTPLSLVPERLRRRSGRRAAAPSVAVALAWDVSDCALQSVPVVAVLVPERFRVGYAFGGTRFVRSPATGERTIPKMR